MCFVLTIQSETVFSHSVEIFSIYACMSKFETDLSIAHLSITKEGGNYFWPKKCWQVPSKYGLSFMESERQKEVALISNNQLCITVFHYIQLVF